MGIYGLRYLRFFRWWVSSNGATSTAKPWVSTLKWSNDWDDLGYPYFRTPPYVMIVLRSKSLQVIQLQPKALFGTRESPWPAALGEMKRGTTDALGSGHVQL